MTGNSLTTSFEALLPEVERFKNDEDPVVVTDEKLERFLVATDQIDLDRCARLISLATLLDGNQIDGGWTGFYRILELARKISPDNMAVLAALVHGAFDYWLTENNAANVEEKTRIADSVENLLLQRLQADPSLSWSSHMLGLLYYKHPKRHIDESLYVRKALEWFNKALETASRSRVRIELHQGHCYYDLADWESALEIYEAIDQALIERLEGKAAADDLRVRIMDCVKRLP